MGKFEALANQIVEYVGGVGNIDSLTHCMTRLRFVLKEPGAANVEALKALKGVQGVVTSNGQFQVVIGTDVPAVYDEIVKLGSFGSTTGSAPSDEKVGPVAKVLGAITAIFQPILPAICGAGMIRAVLALLVFLNAIDSSSQTYVMLNMFADAAFYFLPVVLGFSAANYFKCNAFIAAILCAMLLHPTFTGLVGAGEAVSLFGLPVRLASYGNAVVPPLLIVWMQKYVEKFAKKVTPKEVKVFMEPLIIFIVCAPLTFIVVGPLGSYAGDLLAVVFRFLNEEARWVCPVLVGTFCPLLVMTGMHYSIFPIQLTQFATLGYGTILAPGMLCSNIAQAGASFAVAVHSKNRQMKETAFSSGTAALFGITEPALYGVTMKLGRPLISAMIGGGLAGLYAGFCFLRSFTPATPGLLAIPVYIGADMMNVVNAVICIVIAFVSSFIITLIVGFKDVPETGSEKEVKTV